MTADPPAEPAERRLVTMRRAVGQFGALGPVGRARLDRDPAAGLVSERVLALLADLAFEINCQAAPGGTPRTPRPRSRRPPGPGCSTSGWRPS